MITLIMLVLVALFFVVTLTASTIQDVMMARYIAANPVVKVGRYESSSFLNSKD